jgi:hypothetical protein
MGFLDNIGGQSLKDAIDRLAPQEQAIVIAALSGLASTGSALIEQADQALIERINQLLAGLDGWQMTITGANLTIPTITIQLRKPK